MTAQAGPGAGNGYTGGKAKSCLLFLVSYSRGTAARGSGDAALRAACSGLEITDSKPKPKNSFRHQGMDSATIDSI